MKKILFFLWLLLVSCYDGRGDDLRSNEVLAEKSKPVHLTNRQIMTIYDPAYSHLKNDFIKKYKKRRPRFFSAWQKGLVKSIRTREKIVAFTFDGCGTKKGRGYDKKLIDFLVANNIPATLFASGVWIDYNPKVFRNLCGNQLFEIGNHGLLHRPLTVTGRYKYRIKGTRDVGEVLDEVWLNSRKIEMICGKKPVFFRAGTAYYDDIAIKIIYDLKHIPINFTVSPGDYDSRFTEWQLAWRIVRRAKRGAIILMHMNHPEGKTYKAVKLAVRILKKRGYRFVKLSDYVRHLKD